MSIDLSRKVNKQLGDDAHPIAKLFVRQLSSTVECLTAVGNDGKPLIDAAVG